MKLMLRNPHPGFARRRPAEQQCLAASPTVTRQTPRVIIGLWPHISPVTLSHSILVIKRYNLRLYVVFSVFVTWRQLPRYGPSSPKRLEQQGRLSVNPPARRSGVKSSALVCLPFAILPNQTRLTAAYQLPKILQQHHNIHQKRPCKLWPMLPLLLGSVDARRLDWAWREQSSCSEHRISMCQ